MLSHPTGTAMLSNVHLTCCLDGTNMVSLSLCMSRIQQEISKQTKAAPSCPLGLSAASQFCLLSELTTSEPSFIGVSGLYLYIFGETNPQPSCTVRGKQRDYWQDWSSSSSTFTQNTRQNPWHQFENNEQFFCYQSQDTANSKFSHRAEQMKLFDHILRTRPQAHSLHTLLLVSITNRSELGLKGNSLSRLSYQIRVRS